MQIGPVAQGCNRSWRRESVHHRAMDLLEVQMIDSNHVAARAQMQRAPCSGELQVERLRPGKWRPKSRLEQLGLEEQSERAPRRQPVGEWLQVRELGLCRAQKCQALAE